MYVHGGSLEKYSQDTGEQKDGRESHFNLYAFYHLFSLQYAQFIFIILKQLYLRKEFTGFSNPRSLGTLAKAVSSVQWAGSWLQWVEQ